MKHDIIHKTTGQIVNGEWDSEYLNFIHDDGLIGWDEYNHWEPHEKPVIITKSAKFEDVLSIRNQILFIDLELMTLKGEMKKVTIPLKVDHHTKSSIHFHPLVGRLLFWKCSLRGHVVGRKERIYQKPIGQSYKYMLTYFQSIKNELCDVCLGIDQNVCHKCSK